MRPHDVRPGEDRDEGNPEAMTENGCLRPLGLSREGRSGKTDRGNGPAADPRKVRLSRNPLPTALFQSAPDGPRLSASGAYGPFIRSAPRSCHLSRQGRRAAAPVPRPIPGSRGRTGRCSRVPPVAGRIEVIAGAGLAPEAAPFAEQVGDAPLRHRHSELLTGVTAAVQGQGVGLDALGGGGLCCKVVPWAQEPAEPPRDQVDRSMTPLR